MYVKNRPHSAFECTTFEKLTAKTSFSWQVSYFGCFAFIYNWASPAKILSNATPSIVLGVSNHDVFAVKTVPDQRLKYSVHVTLDESSFLALSQEESSFNVDYSVNNFSFLDSSNNRDLNDREVTIDTPDVRRDGSNDNSSEFQYVSSDGVLKMIIVVHLSIQGLAEIIKNPIRYRFRVMKPLSCELTTSNTTTVEDARNSLTQKISFRKAAIEYESENQASKRTCSTVKYLIQLAQKPLLTHVILNVKRD